MPCESARTSLICGPFRGQGASGKRPPVSCADCAERRTHRGPELVGQGFGPDFFSAGHVKDGVGVAGVLLMLLMASRVGKMRSLMRAASRFTSSITGSAPVPVPMRSRLQVQGIASSAESGVYPNSPRNFCDAFFLRLRTCPWAPRQPRLVLLGQFRYLRLLERPHPSSCCGSRFCVFRRFAFGALFLACHNAPSSYETRESICERTPNLPN